MVQADRPDRPSEHPHGNSDRRHRQRRRAFLPRGHSAPALSGRRGSFFRRIIQGGDSESHTHSPPLKGGLFLFPRPSPTGLAQSKTWRTPQRPRNSRSVPECEGNIGENKAARAQGPADDSRAAAKFKATDSIPSGVMTVSNRAPLRVPTWFSACFTPRECRCKGSLTRTAPRRTADEFTPTFSARTAMLRWTMQWHSAQHRGITPAR